MQGVVSDLEGGGPLLSRGGQRGAGDNAADPLSRGVGDVEGESGDDAAVRGLCRDLDQVAWVLDEECELGGRGSSGGSVAESRARLVAPAMACIQGRLQS